MLGFFSTSTAMLLVPGTLLAIVTGTTAPFSAMSGEVIVMSLLSTGCAPPSALTTSASDFVSNAALFHVPCCAHAAPPSSRPAAISTEPPPTACRNLRRSSFIGDLLLVCSLRAARGQLLAHEPAPCFDRTHAQWNGHLAEKRLPQETEGEQHERGVIRLEGAHLVV